ncbi:MAG TPA: SDR family NAD(P)-dependent oxidoreductase [Dehalococcoidia bacterium]|nr:SDR family NAD(P)-dependent oxidoreductase [Dehalococcoidia bacterium]
MAQRFGTVGGILEALRRSIEEHCQTARALCPLDEGAPLAQSHGTRYPIVQGPMTRVSDTAAFALAVAEGGALPFLALALMRGPQVKPLLEETREKLGGRPWGVGILGFVPAGLRLEQLEAIRGCRPPFVLIAGGRPDQARALEQDGIATYLHVPSPGLLRLFLDDGARRFVFEGRECGGHVGPRCSLVLWETMVEALLEWTDAGHDGSSLHILFAGGVHDDLSAAMVATLAAPLAAGGVKVGVLMGTAYLFTDEAVAAGAITDGYRKEAMRCDRTVLLETGPGHSTRVAETPYADTFQREKRKLVKEGLPPEQVRNTLEELNIGRLRIATKGIDRNPGHDREAAQPEFLTLSEEEQRRQGTYMIGQVAALRDRACTIEQLHHNVAVEGSARLRSLPLTGEDVEEPRGEPSAVAIVGMGCVLPGAHDVRSFWENILNKVDAISEVPPDRWDSEAYFDADRKAKDKVYSKWGGFLEDVPFDPAAWGIPPNALPSIEPVQLLTLEVVKAALQDAGYWERPFDRERTSIVLGAGGGAGDIAVGYITRSMLPTLFGEAAPEIAERVGDTLPEWTEDSFAGLLANVAAGRVANRLNFGGLNCTIDAACASSLAAIHMAVRELDAGTSDVVIAGGIDAMQNPFSFLCFSETEALSPSGRCRPYDASADGIAISEGVAAVVLKRLADAERDGDRIYAVVRGVGASSDGRQTGLTAPRPEGQVLALQRAYAKAGLSPANVGLVEGHGTGTVAGDQAEVMALTQVFSAAGAVRQSCALGSVKSMIGHTKCTAGVASLIKTALALHHKVLPPTLIASEPNPKARFDEGPLYVNTEPRPWLNGVGDHPRCAGVSAFGFGGTNFHVVLEEYTGEYLERRAPPAQEWPAEVFIWRAESREGLLKSTAAVEEALANGARPALRDLAYSLYLQAANMAGPALAIVAATPDELRQRLAWAREALADGERSRIDDPRGIYFAAEPLAATGKTAFLFPGQGSQYVDMLKDLATQFPEVRADFQRADAALKERLPRPLSSFIFPPPTFTEEEEKANQAAITEANVAQPAMGAANIAILHLLKSLGVEADFTAGHSYGEFVALYAAGVLSGDDLFVLSEARGRFFVEEAGPDPGTMAAVEGAPEAVSRVLRETKSEAIIANVNSPRQSVISGTRAAVERSVQVFQERGMRARQLNVACGYHSPLVARAEGRLAQFLSSVEFKPPRLAVYSNTTAAPYPREPQAMAKLLARQLASPVRFMDEIEAMYRDGARIFVEVGPRSVLSRLAAETLGERPHLSVAADQPGRPGLVQLHHLLAQLVAHGVSVKLERLYEGRARGLDLRALARETSEKALAPTTWLVNGGGAHPFKAPSARGAAAKPVPLNVWIAGEGEGQRPRAAAAAPATPPAERPTAPALPGAGAPPAAATPLSAGAGSDEIMAQFQHLMGTFLETQKNVMLAYLSGAPGAAAPGYVPAAATADARSEPTPAPAQPAPLDVQPEPEHAEPEAPVALPASNGAGALDREALTARLVAIVSERTGYPPEVIELDADLEADLGIDSIKRIEILGTLRQSFAQPEEEDEGDAETLAATKTLRGIVELILAGPGTGERPQAPVLEPLPASAAAGQGAVEPASAAAEVQRYTLRAMEAAPQCPGALPAGRVILMTDDEAGIAEAVAAALESQGYATAIVRAGSEPAETAPGRYTADLTAEAGVAALLEIVRSRQGPIGGLAHLLPLRAMPAFGEFDLGAWRERLDLEVKGLFLLSKALADELKLAAGEGSFLLAATGMGGTFAGEGDPDRFFPGHGGVVGYVKTLAEEWPEVRVRALDVDPRETASTLAELLLTEMAGDDEHVEVGYAASRRLVLRPILAPLGHAEQPEVSIEGSWVVLVTGGARGITAEVALELAQCYRPTLLLVGRTPLPEEEPADTAGLVSPQELKAALIERMREQGRQALPARVEAAYHCLLRDREMRRNLAELERTGATVGYYQADVRDEQAFGEVIAEVYEAYGRLDGVIHGAGVIEDKLVKDKTVESFDRVFDTKTASAFMLSRHLRPESLRFLVFFSSVSGRFGNRGQADYAAANEVVNKLALELDRRWPARVVAMNWGPWLKAGMVSGGVQRQFAERGVVLIPPEAGREALDAELRYGRKGQAEVLIGGGWAAEPADASASGNGQLDGGLPLVAARASVCRTDNGTVELCYTLDPALDLYLGDHRLNGKPVMPLAMALELMAEAAQARRPELQVTAVRDLRLLRGVVVENGQQHIRVVTKVEEATGGGVTVQATIVSGEAPQRRHYQALIDLASRPGPEAEEQARPLAAAKPFPLSAEEAYRDILFHGPLFQGIKEIAALAPDGASALLTPSSPERCLSGGPESGWLADPVVIDSALQLQLLWGRKQWDITSLPSRIGSLRLFGPLSGSHIRCETRIEPLSARPTSLASHHLYGADGQLLALLEDVELVGSKSLNRSASAQPREAGG